MPFVHSLPTVRCEGPEDEVIVRAEDAEVAVDDEEEGVDDEEETAEVWLDRSDWEVSSGPVDGAVREEGRGMSMA